MSRASSMSLLVVAFGFVLNCGFSYLNGRWLFSLGPERDASWLADPRMVLGAALVALGLGLPVTSDLILRSLRQPVGPRHVLPTQGPFRWVSSPNHLGELIEGTGWSLATRSLAVVALLAVSAATLVPRALRNHRWYRERFPDHPPRHRGLVPFLF